MGMTKHQNPSNVIPIGNRQSPKKKPAEKPASKKKDRSIYLFHKLFKQVISIDDLLKESEESATDERLDELLENLKGMRLECQRINDALNHLIIKMEKGRKAAKKGK